MSGKKGKYAAPTPPSKTATAARRPPPGAASPDQIRNPTFGKPSPQPSSRPESSNGTLPKKHRSGGHHKAKKPSAKKASRFGKSALRAILTLSLVYLITNLVFCPECASSITVKKTLEPTLVPLYNRHLKPHLQPYLTSTSELYRSYGRPIVTVVTVAGRKGNSVYWVRVHPIVLRISDVVYKGYAFTLKPVVDRYAGSIKDKYVTHVEPSIVVARGTVNNLAGKARDVHVEYVQPIVDAAAPHISRGVRFAQPYAETASKVTVTYAGKSYGVAAKYYVAYVDPAARKVGHAVAKFWRDVVWPIIGRTWKNRIVPALLAAQTSFDRFLEEDDTLVIEDSNHAGTWGKRLFQGIIQGIRITLREVYSCVRWIATFIAECWEDEVEEIEAAREDAARTLVDTELRDLERIVEVQASELDAKVRNTSQMMYDVKVRDIVEKRQSEVYTQLRLEKEGFERVTVPRVKNDRSLDADARRAKIKELGEEVCVRMEQAGKDFDVMFRGIVDAAIAEIDADIITAEKAVDEKIAVSQRLVQQNTEGVEIAVVREVEMRVEDAAAKARERIGKAVSDARQIAQNMLGVRHQKQRAVEGVIRRDRKEVREASKKVQEIITDWIKDHVKEAVEAVEEMVGTAEKKIDDRREENKAHVQEEVETIAKVVGKVAGKDGE